MEIADVLKLLGGIALFLYGMDVMGSSLQKLAGGKLKAILGSLTSNVFKGFLLGLVVTAVIQSSAATIVMVVGFVNSGLMTLTQATGVIMGANIGTSITGWVISASGISGGDSIYYVLAFVGVLLFCFSKKQKKKYVGLIIIGFAVLMIGMKTMSSSVDGLKNLSAFVKFLDIIKNPILGMLFGAIFTALIQSSSASVGVLQSFSSSITLDVCFPYVMGANIGTCITALISSFGANKNAKRASMIHLLYNVISTAILLTVYCLLTSFVGIKVLTETASPVSIAIVNTCVKILALLIMMPCSKLLVNLSCKIISDKKEEFETQLLDERLLITPTVAIERCRTVAVSMAEAAVSGLRESIHCIFDYNSKMDESVRKSEDMVDTYEDKIGTYLVKLSSYNLTELDSIEANKLLHVIGDFERISDHSINILESAAEIYEKKMSFTDEATKELHVMLDAVDEILGLALECFRNDDIDTASMVEPLEQVVDYLRDYIKAQHIKRLQKQECSIEMGFILSDILTNLERVSDHCSNVACCLIEISHDSMEFHEYIKGLKTGANNETFQKNYMYFKNKYSIA